MSGQRVLIREIAARKAVAEPSKRAIDVHRSAMAQEPRMWANLQGSAGNAAVARLISAQRAARSENVTSVSRATQRRIDAERAEGRPLESETRSEMEPILGAQLSGVRLHSGRSAARLARDLNARAFTQGRHVFFGDGAQRETLSHELTHVAQARTGPGTIDREAANAQPSAPPVPGAVIRKPTPKVRERIVDRSEIAELNRTVAKIEIVGHASPRWRGARTPEIADENNWRLAEQRAEMTRMEVETLLTQLLPNRQLVFQYRFKRASERQRDSSVHALDEPADVALDVEARGSTDTLAEAGPQGRRSNADAMRRVDVKVTLHSETETDVAENVERTSRKSGATRDWGIRVAGEAGAEDFVKGSAILVQLRNNKTGAVGHYAGVTLGFGASLGVSIAKTSLPNFASFTTPELMSFADFSGSTFRIESFGLGIGVGLEWSRFTFERFRGGEDTPDGIQVGGISFGGIGINLGSKVDGMMLLVDHPPEQYYETTQLTRIQTFESLSREDSAHRVLFATGSPAVTPWESDMLNEYLYGIVVRSGL